MPNTKSAEKALRQSRRRRAANRTRTDATKAVIKEYKKLLASNKEDAAKKLPAVYKRLDKLAKTNVIKKGKADRLKSRLASRLRKTG